MNLTFQKIICISIVLITVISHEEFNHDTKQKEFKEILKQRLNDPILKRRSLQSIDSNDQSENVMPIQTTDNMNQEENECLPGEFYHSSIELCLMCGLDCDDCLSADECKTCSSGFQKKGKICMEQKKPEEMICPPGKYYDPSYESCSSCSYGCGNCSNYTDCNTCLSGFENMDGICVQPEFTHFYRKNNQCLPGRFYDLAVKRCFQCPQGCLDCSSDTDCKTCDSGFEKVNNLCVYPQINQQKNKKQMECPPGEYYHSILEICFKCYDGCDDCSDGDDCKTCSPGFQKVNNVCLNLEKNQMKYEEKECPLGQFYDPSVRLCTSCTFGCDDCIDENDCNTCSPDYEKVDGFCVLSITIKKNINVEQCPPGQFYDDFYKDCQQCQIGCADCIGSIYCKTCESGFRKFHNSCIKDDTDQNPKIEDNGTENKCPPGQLYSPRFKRCFLCSLGCLECTSMTFCTVCDTKAGFQLFKGWCKK